MKPDETLLGRKPSLRQGREGRWVLAKNARLGSRIASESPLRQERTPRTLTRRFLKAPRPSGRASESPRVDPETLKAWRLEPIGDDHLEAVLPIQPEGNAAFGRGFIGSSFGSLPSGGALAPPPFGSWPAAPSFGVWRPRRPLRRASRRGLFRLPAGAFSRLDRPVNRGSSSLNWLDSS